MSDIDSKKPAPKGVDNDGELCPPLVPSRDPRGSNEDDALATENTKTPGAFSATSSDDRKKKLALAPASDETTRNSEAVSMQNREDDWVTAKARGFSATSSDDRKKKLALAPASDETPRSSEAVSMQNREDDWVTAKARGTGNRGSKGEAQKASTSGSVAVGRDAGERPSAAKKDISHNKPSSNQQHQDEEAGTLVAAEVAPDVDEEVAAAFERGRQQALEQQGVAVAVGTKVEVAAADSDDEDGDEGGSCCSPGKITLAALVLIAIIVGVVVGTGKSDAPAPAGPTPTPAPIAVSTSSPTIPQVPEFFIQQVGELLNGSPADNFGSSVSLSSDGRTLAVGAMEPGSTGYVNLYKLTDGPIDEASSWTLLNTFTGDDVGDMFGYSVSISGDATALAVGIPGAGSDGGRVQVFDIGSESSWPTIGSDLIGDINRFGKFGFSVSLSDDGTMLAVGEPEYDQTENDDDYIWDHLHGRLIVYELNGDDWTMVGSTTGGNGSRLGWAVDLKGSGDLVRIAVSGRGGDDVSGQGQVFELNGGNLVRIGQSLGDGELGGVSMSQDGTVVAFSGVDGGTESPGFVSVYRYDHLTNWTEMGTRILVKNALGAPSVSLSPNGELLAIGNIVFDSDEKMQLFYFENSTNTWTPLEEEPFLGRQLASYTRSSVALVGTRDDFTFAIGAPFASTAAESGGTAAVFHRKFGVMPTLTWEPTPGPTAATAAFEESKQWFGTENFGIENDIVGNSVSLSEDGRVLAYGYVHEGVESVVEVYLGESYGDSPAWRQIGRLTSQSLGGLFALSGNGLVIAMAGNMTVRVFEYDSGRGTWRRYGGDIDKADLVGFDDVVSLSLSYDGSTVAVGAYLIESCCTSVAIYRIVNGAWQQLGNSPEFGSVVSLSHDGNRVAIAHDERDHMFEYADGQWQQLGQEMTGYPRAAIALSGDGKVVAVGSFDIDNGTRVGHVRVYRYDEMTQWTQVGVSLVAEAREDGFGRALSLSPDGKRLAIGANSGGYVKIFEYDDENTYWRQVGATLKDGLGGGGFGWSVALADTNNGMKLAVGSPFFVRSASALTGKVAFFEQPTINTPTESPRLSIGDVFPLKACEGNCQTNSDCDRGLSCFERGAGESVPGCTGGEEDSSSANYCYECRDVPGWSNNDRGLPCSWYHESDAPGCPIFGTDLGLFGLTANEACCHCRNTNCGNVPNWGDEYDNTCGWYELNDEYGCPNTGENGGSFHYSHGSSGGSYGMTPNFACCHCQPDRTTR